MTTVKKCGAARGNLINGCEYRCSREYHGEDTPHKWVPVDPPPLEENLKTLSDLIQWATDLPCWNVSCASDRDVTFSGQLPKKVYERLCPTCRAYWHMQMARNAVIEYGRTR